MVHLGKWRLLRGSDRRSSTASTDTDVKWEGDQENEHVNCFNIPFLHDTKSQSGRKKDIYDGVNRV